LLPLLRPLFHFYNPAQDSKVAIVAGPELQEDRRMVRAGAGVAVLVAGLALAGCSGLSDREQRTLTGGAIGAAGGAGVAAVTGGSLLLGSVIGGAAGAAVGGLTDIGKKR